MDTVQLKSGLTYLLAPPFLATLFLALLSATAWSAPAVQGIDLASGETPVSLAETMWSRREAPDSTPSPDDVTRLL